MTGAQGLAPPDLSAPGADRIVTVEGGVVVPVSPELPRSSVQRSGVLDARGALVPESLTWRGGALVSHPPEAPDPAGIADLAGSHMFGGILFGHFGHFLAESTARLWAWDRLAGTVESIVFVPKVQRNTEHVLATQAPLLRLLGIGCRLVNAPAPLRVERLHVPSMGFGLWQMIEGLADYRRFMRERLARAIAPAGGERLYVSRTRLPAERGGLLGEAKIEGWLAAEGYDIFHPQLHSFAEQIARYRAARTIISPDGSPLHLVALAAMPGTRVAIIPRRPDGIAEMLARQLRAFAGIEPVMLNYPARNWIPVRDRRPSRSSFGDIDIAELGLRLAAAGFIASAAPWVNHGEAERAELLAALTERQRTEFKLYIDPAPPGS